MTIYFMIIMTALWASVRVKDRVWTANVDLCRLKLGPAEDVPGEMTSPSSSCMVSSWYWAETVSGSVLKFIFFLTIWESNETNSLAPTLSLIVSLHAILSNF